MHVASEKHYQAIFFGIMAILGADIKAEEPTNDGRIDAVIETTSHILIFEFKINSTSEAALAQIEEKKYYQKFLLKNKIILLIGASFDTEKRNLASWVVKEYSPQSIS